MAKDTAAYRMALERAIYGGIANQAAPAFEHLTNQIASLGPLADSGAAAGLKARLASNLYGAAENQVARGLSDFTGSYLGNQQQLRNQMALLKYQKGLQPSGFSQFAGKAVGAGLGFLAGGPPGAVAGSGLTSSGPPGSSGGYAPGYEDYRKYYGGY